MRCPRCKSAVPESAETCPRCAAPLRLRDEPAPVPIDGDLDLDRRSLPRAGPPGEGETDPSPWRAPPAGAPAPGSRDPASAPGGDRPPRTTPPFWLKAPGQEGRGDPGPEPLDAASVIEEGPGSPAEDGFEVLGPVPGTRRPAGPGRRTRRPAQAQVPLPFPAEILLEPAPFWRRLASWAADGILAGALAWLLVAGGARLAGGEGEGPALWPHALGLAALLHFAHATLGHALSGQTLGKWMTGLLLVGPDGRRPGPGRAALRALLSLLSAAPAGLGLLVALADRKGRTLHDLAAGTAVVQSP